MMRKSDCHADAPSQGNRRTGARRTRQFPPMPSRFTPGSSRYGRRGRAVDANVRGDAYLEAGVDRAVFPRRRTRASGEKCRRRSRRSGTGRTFCISQTGSTRARRGPTNQGSACRSVCPRNRCQRSPDSARDGCRARLRRGQGLTGERGRLAHHADQRFVDGVACALPGDATRGRSTAVRHASRHRRTATPSPLGVWLAGAAQIGRDALGLRYGMEDRAGRADRTRRFLIAHIIARCPMISSRLPEMPTLPGRAARPFPATAG